MKKIIPITALICAVITFAVAVVGLISVSVATKANEFTLFAVPVAIVGLTLSLVGSSFSFLFKKDILCKISLGIDIAAFTVSVTAIIVWLTCI